MRATGTIDRATGLGRHDHVCWSYAGDDELGTAVTEYLAEGVADGQRVAYAAAGSLDDLRTVVRGLPRVDRLVADGTLLLLPLVGLYHALDADGQVATYGDHTRTALAAGYTGFRVAAEVTPLVIDPVRRQAFARYEHLIDRYMAAAPMAAMCAYDRARLRPDELAEIACAHPAVHGPDDLAPFRLHAVEGGGVAIAGEVDALVGPLFRRLLDALPPGDVDIDAAELDFIDQHGLRALDDLATDGRRVRLTGARPGVARLRDLLRLERVEVVV